MIALIAVLQSSEPILVPSILLLCGLVAALLASIHFRRREARTDGRSRAIRLLAQVALIGYLLVSVSAFGLAGVEVLTRWQLFWCAHWEEGQRTLVLERWGPIPDVRIERAEIEAITEFSIVERSLFGPRRSVQFVVRMDSGESYWSGPFRHPLAVALTRKLLITATNDRLERYVVGNDSQFR